MSSSNMKRKLHDQRGRNESPKARKAADVKRAGPYLIGKSNAQIH